MQTIKCEYCNSVLKTGEKFCHSCGASNSNYNQEDEIAFNVELAKAKEDTKMAAIIMVGMVIFCVVLCATVFGIFFMVGM